MKQSFDNGLNKYIKTGTSAVNAKTLHTKADFIDKGHFGDRFAE